MPPGSRVPFGLYRTREARGYRSSRDPNAVARALAPRSIAKFGRLLTTKESSRSSLGAVAISRKLADSMRDAAIREVPHGTPLAPRDPPDRLVRCYDCSSVGHTPRLV